MSIIIKNVLHEQKHVDILIKRNKITKISKKIDYLADTIIDASDMVILPSFFNGHTHSAMTLFRGYADDLPLNEWLKNHIWPLESKLTEEYVYWGTKLACLEMIKGGTTFVNDMYWYPIGTARAIEEMGIRALISEVYIDNNNPELTNQSIKNITSFFKKKKIFSDRVNFGLGPHALYTVSENLLKWTKQFADKNKLLIHFHVSETSSEVDECIKKTGMRPIEYLEKINFLGPNLIACHAIWLDENEIQICKKHKVKIVYNPVSNLKLSSGINFPYQNYIEKGIDPVIGTDGTASNNNLSILESLKFASLIQKGINNPETLPARKAFEMATNNGAKTFNINSGKIKEGMLADIILIKLKNPQLTPNFNLLSNMIYSADNSCIDTVICNGQILMKNRKVKNENEILEKSAKKAYQLCRKI